MHLRQWLAKHEYTRLLLVGIAFWVPLIIFLKIAGEVLEREPIRSDIIVLQWAHSIANPVLDAFFLTATNVGGIIGSIVIMTLITLALLYKRQVKDASLLLACVGGAAAANLALKALFSRPRPSLFRTEVVETSFSFPSGHAMASSALALTLVLLAWNTKWRWPVTVGAVLFAIVVGVSRPYFGVHYPSDIVAGWCASTAWVLAVFVTMKRIKLRTKRNRTEASLQSGS